ncbi:DUF223 domain protein [Medicago truncatula]|uniref:DUF223 domain protein n=1 Tax=Medicago truncatula TaxID=3880 RepID=G7I2Q6_MEDTR|nr:DUF223 domain protein [Medicago truncatula]
MDFFHTVFCFGDRICVFIRRTLIYKFKEQLQEGMAFTISLFDFACNSGLYRPSHNEYKLNFTINTKIKIFKSSLVPTNMYSFTLHMMFSMILTT